MSEKLRLVLSSETTGATFPEDTKAYASHHGAAFEQINENGMFAFVELHESEMDRVEDGFLSQELYNLRARAAKAEEIIRTALDVLERWNGYQDRIAAAVKILRGKNPAEVTKNLMIIFIKKLKRTQMEIGEISNSSKTTK